MKQLLLLLALLVSTFKVESQPNLAVEYRFENGTSGTLSPHYVNPLLVLSASDMYFGPGLSGPPGTDNSGANGTGFGCSCQPNDRAAWASSWGTNGQLTPPDMNDYFGISITPVDANPLVIDSITWWSRRSGTGPRLTQVRSSIDSYGSALWTSPDDLTVLYVKNVATFFLPTFGTTTDFRLYGYRPSAQNGTLRIDSIKVYAHVDLGPLPITLLSFTGEASGRSTLLKWQTASETDNSHFTISRSKNLEDWEDLGRVNGSGSSQTMTSYSFVDQTPPTGTSYYRLKQTGFDESEESWIVAVTHQNVTGAAHPIGSTLYIDGKRFTLIDGSGRVVEKEVESCQLLQTGTFVAIDEEGFRMKILVYY